MFPPASEVFRYVDHYMNKETYPGPFSVVGRCVPWNGEKVLIPIHLPDRCTLKACRSAGRYNSGLRTRKIHLSIVARYSDVWFADIIRGSEKNAEGELYT